MMKSKKISVVVLIIMMIGILCSFIGCLDTADLILDSVNASTGGWSYVGWANSESECSDMVANSGYVYYRFNSDTNSCYGQN